MLRAALAWTLGVYAVLLLPALPAASAASGLVALAIPCLFRPNLRWCALLLAGIAWGIWRASALESALLDTAHELQALEIYGRVVDLPEVDSDRTRFRLAVDRVTGPDGERLQGPLPRVVQLSWYGGPGVEPGDYYRFEARLRRPRGLANFGLFNYGSWLLGEGIGGTGYVAGEAERLPDRDLRGSLSRWRARIGDWLVATREEGQGGLLAALAVGDRRAVDAGLWDRFVAAGLVHLLAISGLHIGIATACGVGLARMLARCGALLGRHWDAVRWGCAGGALLATAYAAASGFALPTQRALIMAFAFLAAQWLRWRVPVTLLLALAMAGCAAIDPLAALTRSLWLSFGAVAVLISYFSARAAGWGAIRSLFAAQWALLLGYSALLAALTGLVAPLNALANLIAVPVTSLVTVPLLLAAIPLQPLCPPLAELLLDGAGLGVEVVQYLSTLFATAELSRWRISMPPLATVAAGITGGFVLLLPRGAPLRKLGWALLIPLLVPGYPSPPAARVTIVDVGQGSAALIETPNQLTVIDTGARFSERFDSGADLLAPLLHRAGHTTIDRLIISHGDADHAGGARALLAEWPVRRVDVGMHLPELDAQQHACRAGDAWQADGVHFRYLYPAADDAGQRLSDNDRSCVLRVEIGSTAFLFPGDITAFAERRLVERNLLDKVDVVVVPHHGSRTSSSAAFVARINPEVAVVSSGYRNPFGHPHPDVVARWVEAGATVFNTAEHGSWRMTWEQDIASRPDMETARFRHRFWWQL